MKPLETFNSFEEAVKYIHDYLKRAQTDPYMDAYTRLGIAQQFTWHHTQYSSSTEITICDIV